MDAAPMDNYVRPLMNRHRGTAGDAWTAYGAVARNFVGKAGGMMLRENGFILIIPQNVPVEGGYGSITYRTYWKPYAP